LKRLANAKRNEELAQKKQKGVKIELSKEELAQKKSKTAFKKASRGFKKYLE
jgi:hypothetical protein